MIRRRHLLLFLVIAALLFLLSTHYLLLNLQLSYIEVRKTPTIEQKIFLELEKLPENYKQKPVQSLPVVDLFISNTKNITVIENTEFDHLWKQTNSWVSKGRVVDFTNPDIGKVLQALKVAEITKADLDTRGTQLKFLLTLQGNQQVIFKPKWYEKEKIIEGPVYAGKDRYGSEILGFYLSVLLNKPFTPLSVERTISLKRNLLPVATKRLLDTFFKMNNGSCIYGKCFFCRKEDPLCENEGSSTTGAVIFNIKTTFTNHRHPWQRTYKKGRKALWQEFPETYCRTVKERLSKKRLYDLIDLAIFDFLIQNGDRHHYETIGETIIWLDNGKGLGNPFLHHLDILSPLYQCCILRRDTLRILLALTGGQLQEKLRLMTNTNNYVTELHLAALEKRLLLVFATIEYCNKLKQADSINSTHHKQIVII